MDTGSAAKLRWPCRWSQPRAILLLSGSLWNTPPSRSATVMVSETVYNTDGTVQAVVVGGPGPMTLRTRASGPRSCMTGRGGRRR